MDDIKANIYEMANKQKAKNDLEYEELLKRIKHMLSTEIYNIFYYYRITPNEDAINNFTSEILIILKNQSKYKQIVNKNNDALSYMINSGVNNEMIKEQSLKEQNNLNKSVDLSDLIQEIRILLRKTFRNLSEDITDEVYMSMRRLLSGRVAEQINEFNENIIKSNKVNLLDYASNNLSNKNNTLESCKKAMRELPSSNAKDFILNEISMLDNNEALEIINRLKFELPFGDSELKLFLEEQEQRIREDVRQNNYSAISDFK